MRTRRQADPRALVILGTAWVLLLLSGFVHGQHFGVWTPRLIGSTETFWEDPIDLSQPTRRVVWELPIYSDGQPVPLRGCRQAYIARSQSMLTARSVSRGPIIFYMGEARGSMFPLLEDPRPFEFEIVESIEWKAILSVMVEASERCWNKWMRGNVQIPDMWAESRHRVVPGLNATF